MKSNVNHPRNRIFIIGRALLLCAALLLPNISAGPVEAADPISSGDILNLLAPEAIWEVNSLLDSGPGSLREALASAAAGDRIEFDATIFPPENPGTISILSELPHITKFTKDGLTIDAVGRGVILDGSGLPTDNTAGLWLDADNITIQGLQVLNFPTNGISLFVSANSLIGGDRLEGEGNRYASRDSER